jgi:hypothetical protein
VLIIGLGSGVTLASALVHPVARADIVEISPEVVEASKYFAAENRAALDDPRSRLIVGDGRSHVQLSSRTLRCHHHRAVESLDGRRRVSVYAGVFHRPAPPTCAGRDRVSVDAHIRNVRRQSAVPCRDVPVRFQTPRAG